MSAKSEAAKQFAKEQELEKLRLKKAATDAKLSAMPEADRLDFLKNVGQECQRPEN